MLYTESFKINNENINMADEPVACPTLAKNAKDVLTSRSEICKQIVDFSFKNPGFISESMERDMIAFKPITARSEHSQESIATAYETALQNAIDEYYPNGGITVSVQSEAIDTSWYKLKVYITNELNESVISVVPNFSVNTADNTIEQGTDIFLKDA
jgi:hypothetical protein